MIVPSGNGSFPSRYALVAISLPKTARKSLRLPSSWATETTGQSRYPGGVLIPKIGATWSSSCAAADDAKPMMTEPAVNAISNKAIRFICLSFLVEVLFFPSCYFILSIPVLASDQNYCRETIAQWYWQYLGITRGGGARSPASVELHGHFVPAPLITIGASSKAK